jgi:hypothetical protein
MQEMSEELKKAISTAQKRKDLVFYQHYETPISSSSMFSPLGFAGEPVTSTDTITIRSRSGGVSIIDAKTGKLMSFAIVMC